MYLGNAAIPVLCLLNFASSAVADRSLRHRKEGPSLNFGEDEDDYIVVFKDRASHVTFMENEIEAVNCVRHLDFINAEVLRLSNADASQWAERDDVLIFEQDQKVTAFAEEVPHGIIMVEALDIDYVANSGVKACVIDTGYGLGHPDLPTESHVEITGFNPYSDGRWFVDGQGHGTHVAGTMVAIGNNGIGVVGVTSNASMPLHIGKGLGDDGFGSNSGVLAAMESCVQSGAKVINMSLGGPDASGAVEEFLTKLENDGTDVLIVAAAGNNGDSSFSFPASYNSPLVMSVAAVESNGDRAGFSQYNNQVDIAAPGVDIKSTVTMNAGRDFGYTSWDGTSMASPHVAGVAALIWSHYPSKSVADVRTALECSAVMPEQYGDDVKNNEVGYGVVNAKNALALLEFSDFSGCPTIAPTMAPTPLDCSEDIIEIIITTDIYPSETAWVLTNSCSNTEVASEDNHPFGEYEYTTKICVPPGGEYFFRITDSFGDGICCSNGQGSYNILYNGESVASGGEFLNEDIKIFGQCGTPPPSPAPQVTATPSVAPTSSHSPSYPPTTTGAPSQVATFSCPSGQVEFSLTLTTDNYPEETKWVIKEGFRWQTGTTLTTESFGTYTSSQTTYTETICIIKNKSHYFRINDKANDGLCCEHGTGEYSIALNGQGPFYSGGDFGRKESVKFMAFPDYNEMHTFGIEIERERKGVHPYLDKTREDEEEKG